MKHLYLRSCVALLCAATLSSCGGGHGTLVLAGTVTGLLQPNLVLTNNGGSDLAVASGAVSFQFADLLVTDAAFDVEVKTQPTQTVCTPFNNTGKASSFNTTTLVINCVTNSFAVGGSITGLGANAGLKLINGTDTVTINDSTGVFVFPVKVAFGSPYGITVLQQPSNGKTCSVSNGAGRITVPSDVNNVQVSCV